MRQTAAMFVSLVDRALSGASGSGEGVDVEVLEVAVRALARLGLTGEGELRRGCPQSSCVVCITPKLFTPAPCT